MDGPVIDFITSEGFLMGGYFGFIIGSVLACWLATSD